MSCKGKHCGPLCGVSKGANGFMWGITAGALFGLMFAKRPGKELRKNLSQAGEKKGFKGAAEIFGKEVVDISKDVKETTKEVAQSDTVKNAVQKTKKAAQDIAKSDPVQKAVSKSREAASHLKDKGVEMAESLKEKGSEAAEKAREKGKATAAKIKRSK